MSRKALLLLYIPLLLTAAFLPSAQAGGVPDQLKSQLEGRYKKQKVKIVPSRILVAPYTQLGFQITESDFKVHYDHFHPAVQMPDKYERRNNLDDRTTAQVQSGTRAVAELETGETLEVRRIMIFRRSRDFYAVDVLLHSLNEKRMPTLVALRESGFGVHFRFAFPPDLIERGDFEAIVKEIDNYLLPETEYRERQHAAELKQAAGKNVSLVPGMSKEDVLRLLGEPQKTVIFGNKTILKYQDFTIELQDNKVTEVKAN